MRPKLTCVLPVVMAMVALLGACDPQRKSAVYKTAVQLTGGSPEQGRDSIRKYGCQACHTIPGVAGADATVGPPLTQFGKRTYIAGELPNTPDNLMKWIRNPHQVEPHTAMPETGVTEQDSRDIAAYLYTLR